MKKLILYILFFLSLIGLELKSQCTSNWFISDLTPNTSWQSSSVGWSGSYNPPYWSFTGIAGETYNFSTCGGQSEDTYLYIYNSSWVLQAFNNNNGPYCSTTKASIDFNCTAMGTYYIVLARNTCSNLTKPHVLQYKKTTCSPTNPSTNLNISQPNLAAMNVTWTRGNGSHVLVIAKEGSSASDPTNGSTYTANNIFGSGTSVGGGFVVYNGTGNSATVNGLVPGVNYYYSIYEYFSTTNCYNLTELTGSAIANTCTSPSTPPSRLTSNLNRGQSLNIGWTRGNGNKVLVIARPNVSPTDPWCGTSYSANTAYGTGDPVGGGFVVYNGNGNSVSVTGLSPDIIYYFSIYEYNNTDLCYNLNELSGSIGFNSSLPSQNITVNRPTYTQTFTISGKVFIDNNGDGQSVSDAGFAGAQINLYKSDGSQLATTYSDGSGLFSFSNRPNGSYYIEVITPLNHQITFANQGNDATDSDIDGLNGPQTSSTFTVSGADYTSLGAGCYACSNIIGRVAFDLNLNHQMEEISTGSGSNGWQTKLYRETTPGNFILFQSNSAPFHTYSYLISLGYSGPYIYDAPSGTNGFFSYSCVPPGNYYIESVYPDPTIYANPNVGGDEWIDSDIDGTFGQGTTAAFSLTSGGLKQDITIAIH